MTAAHIDFYAAMGLGIRRQALLPMVLAFHDFIFIFGWFIILIFAENLRHRTASCAEIVA